MRVLWLCNILLPPAAEALNLKASNKEGWLSGICDVVKCNHEFELAIAFPVPEEYDCRSFINEGIAYIGFYEDTTRPEVYDEALEGRLQKILNEIEPDMVHIFGTEYPHTLAMCRCMKDKPEKVLVGIQGVVSECAAHYLDGVPKRVVDRVTFRDALKKDSLKEQKKKFELRADHEIEALKLAGNVTGRTPFDLQYTTNINPETKYHFMNETLRKEFYEGAWNIDECEKHSIFLSQGNYPLKGLHTMLEAAGLLKEKYADLKIYVAGDKITGYETLKEKIKISSYGRYLLELIKEHGLEDMVHFMGNVPAEEMRERMLKSNVFVCPSSIENSPNSLGEAMLLGVPCIASNVGGISGIFKAGTDGLSFEGGDVKGLAEAVDKMFSSDEMMISFSEKASMHAHITHNPDVNYKRLVEIYREITGCE